MSYYDDALAHNCSLVHCSTLDYLYRHGGFSVRYMPKGRNVEKKFNQNVGLQLTKATYEKVKKIAHRRKCTRSSVVRDAINIAMSDYTTPTKDDWIKFNAGFKRTDWLKVKILAKLMNTNTRTVVEFILQPLR